MLQLWARTSYKDIFLFSSLIEKAFWIAGGSRNLWLQDLFYIPSSMRNKKNQ